MGLVAEKKNVQKFRIVLNTFAYPLAKIVAFRHIGLSLSLKNLHFIEEVLNRWEWFVARISWKSWLICCDNRLVDLRVNCSNLFLTRAAVLTAKLGSLWLLFNAVPHNYTSSVSKLLYQKCSHMPVGNFLLEVFESKLPRDMCRWSCWKIVSQPLSLLPPKNACSSTYWYRSYRFAVQPKWEKKNFSRKGEYFGFFFCVNESA